MGLKLALMYFVKSLWLRTQGACDRQSEDPEHLDEYTGEVDWMYLGILKQWKQLFGGSANTFALARSNKPGRSRLGDRARFYSKPPPRWRLTDCGAS